MWEEGEARRRSCLQRVALKMLIEVKHRREVRLREGHAHGVQSGRRFELDGHLRNLAALREVLWRRRWRRAAASAVGRRDAEAPASLPIEDAQALTVEQNLELLAGNRSEAGWRHVVAKDRRHLNLVLAVGRELVFHQHPTTRAEWQTLNVVVLRCIFRRPVYDHRRRHRLADREAADLPGR